MSAVSKLTSESVEIEGSLLKEKKKKGKPLRYHLTFEPFQLPALNTIFGSSAVNAIISKQINTSKANLKANPKDSASDSDEFVGIYRLVEDNYQIRADYCVPRPDRTPSHVFKKEERKKWKKEDSLFFIPFKREGTPPLLKKCFEVDWKHVKLSSKMPESVVTQIRDTVFEFYLQIKESYKYTSGLS